MAENIYLPSRAKVIKIENLSPTVKLLRLAPVSWLKNDKGLIFTPGQFVMVGKIGYGEVPLGALSPPDVTDYIEVAVRKVGVVTEYLHTLKRGDTATLRGPFGNGFPIDYFRSRELIMATGGCGIPPIAALMEYIGKNRAKFDDVYLLYGAKTPEEILLKSRLAGWQKTGITVMTTIDKPAPGWTGPVGFVSELVPKLKLKKGQETAAAVCGPGAMVHALVDLLKNLGLEEKRIFVSTERKMQCGIGKCQHCTIGSKYACLDGPVFTYEYLSKCWDG